VFLADELKGYRVLDAGDGMKLEDWNGVMLSRPDPQVIWKCEKPWLWKKADARYDRSSSGGGAWSFARELPERWTLNIDDLSFYVRPTGFKHTGLFPEQGANWRFMREQLKGTKGARVLNLFAYTGGATVACAKEGAAVTHVDAAKGMVAWAKENAELSGLKDAPIRYIVDDCKKFVLREQRREKFYEGIVMDPPSYGRGSGGQVWKIEEDLFSLMEETVKLLSPDAKFFVVNSYTTGLSSTVTRNMLALLLKDRGGKIEAADLAIPIEGSDLVLPCGTTARWYK